MARVLDEGSDGTFRVFGQLSKVEERPDGTLLVTGIASSESVDHDGEVIRASAIKAAIPGYMKFGAIREMHQPIAAGRAVAIEVGEDGNTYLEALIVDAGSVKKVKTGVLKGFSIGGRVPPGGRNGANPKVIEKVNLSEISLVDRPANPDAVIQLFKAEGAEAVDKGWEDVPRDENGKWITGESGGGRPSPKTTGPHPESPTSERGHSAERAATVAHHEAAAAYHAERRDDESLDGYVRRAHESAARSHEAAASRMREHNESGGAKHDPFDVTSGSAEAQQESKNAHEKERKAAAERRAHSDKVPGATVEPLSTLDQKNYARGLAASEKAKTKQEHLDAQRFHAEHGTNQSYGHTPAIMSAHRVAAEAHGKASMSAMNPSTGPSDFLNARDATRRVINAQNEQNAASLGDANRSNAQARQRVKDKIREEYDRRKAEDPNKEPEMAITKGHAEPDGDEGKTQKPGGDEADAGGQAAASSLAKCNEENTQKALRIATLEKQVKGAQEALAKAEESLAKLQAERSTDDGKLLKLQADRDGLHEEHEKLRKAVEEHETTVQKLTAERDSVRERVTKLQAERDTLSTEAGKLRTERDSFQGEVEKTVAERDALRERVQKLQSERDTADSQVVKLRSERDSHEHTASRATSDRDALADRLTKVQGERDTIEADLTKARVERDAAETKYEKTVAEHAVIASRLSKVTDERDFANSEVARMRSERDMADDRAEKVAADRDVLEQRLTKAMAEMKGLSEKNSRDVARAEQAESAFAKLQGESKAKDERISKLQAQVEDALLKGNREKARADTAESTIVKMKAESAADRQRITKVAAERDDFRQKLAATEAELRQRPKGVTKAVVVEKAADVAGAAVKPSGEDKEKGEGTEGESPLDAIKKAHQKPTVFKLAAQSTKARP